MNKDICDAVPTRVLITTVAFSTLLLVISTISYIFTKTSNLLAVIAVSLISYFNVFIAILAAHEKLREKRLPRIILPIIFALFVGLVLWKIYHLMSKGFPVEINEPGYALLILILLITLGYIFNLTVEKITPSLYWRIGRFLGEDFITVTYISAFAAIGPAIAFFGVVSLDSPLSLVTLLLALMPAPAKLRSLQMLIKSRENKVAIENAIRSLLAKIPAIKGISEMRIYALGPLASVDLSLIVSELVRNRLDVLGNAIKVPIVDTLGNIVRIHISIATTRDAEILAGIPIEDSKVSDRINGRYFVMRINLRTLEVLDSRIETSDFKEDYEVLEGIVSRKFDVVCLKNIDKKIKNFLDGWFIIPLQLKSEVLDVATKELMESLEKVLISS
ncbi:MAG: hypothetical protein NDP24_04820 [Crenarchaeota archaeon]|nr:hypothetical protein [Thermoproteota archaeon]MCR8470991.1 hypothetical protein [Thermoproteota archaeon]MCR8472270.1 hypothetical protein [Thermoproteota archaeon]MCR8488784.1 hypothetical protein [Thermoproteota archaeon]